MNTRDKRIADFKNANQRQRKKDTESVANTKYISNHQQAEAYFTLAAKYNYEATGYYDDGLCEIALIAIGYANLGMECQQLNAKDQALNNEK